jgi:hypothetical protein
MLEFVTPAPKVSDERTEISLILYSFPDSKSKFSLDFKASLE